MFEDYYLDPMDQFMIATTVLDDGSDSGFPSRGACDDYLSDRRILFDNCANRSIIRNPDLLVDPEDCDITHDVETAFRVLKRHFSMKSKIVIADIAHGVYVGTSARDNIISAGRFEEACIKHKCQWTLHFGSYNDRTTVFNQVEVRSTPGTHDHTTVVYRCTGEKRLAFLCLS